MLMVSEADRDKLVEYLVRSMLPSREVQMIVTEIQKWPEVPSNDTTVAASKTRGNPILDNPPIRDKET